MSQIDQLRRRLRSATGEALRRAWEWSAFAGAVGPDDERGRRFHRLGAGSMLAFPQGALYNEGYIDIGSDTLVGPYASLAVGIAPGQVMPTCPVVRIGDRCIIGRGSHIVGHWSIDIGDDIQTGPYVYVTDQNHSYADPHAPVGRQHPVEAPVRIGDGSWLGANVVVLPGADIGRHVVVAAGAVVRGHIPDHCVVAGVPARIVRRWTEAGGWTDAGQEPAGDPAAPLAAPAAGRVTAGAGAADAASRTAAG